MVISFLFYYAIKESQFSYYNNITTDTLSNNEFCYLLSTMTMGDTDPASKLWLFAFCSLVTSF